MIFEIGTGFVMVLRCINAVMSCLVMRRAGEVLVGSRITSRRMLVVLGDTADTIHHIYIRELPRPFFAFRVKKPLHTGVRTWCH